jgi:hypothetical protein
MMNGVGAENGWERVRRTWFGKYETNVKSSRSGVRWLPAIRSRWRKRIDSAASERVDRLEDSNE